MKRSETINFKCSNNNITISLLLPALSFESFQTTQVIITDNIMYNIVKMCNNN